MILRLMPFRNGRRSCGARILQRTEQSTKQYQVATAINATLPGSVLTLASRCVRPTGPEWSPEDGQR